jgi:hypothetical protein
MRALLRPVRRRLGTELFKLLDVRSLRRLRLLRRLQFVRFLRFRVVLASYLYLRLVPKRELQRLLRLPQRRLWIVAHLRLA